MLRDLTVENVGVIERVELSLGPGSSALTGETGAGKTLLVASMRLLLGDRSDRALVRDGARGARVEGRFVVEADHPAAVALRAHGVLDEGADAEIVIARAVGADGKGSARINGRLVPAALLREVGPSLVEIAGQHEHHRLGVPSSQRDLLDAYAGGEVPALRTELAVHVRRATAAQRRLEELARDERERARELDVLDYEIREIEGAAPEPGEGALLADEARRLEHAEALAAGLRDVADALTADGGAGDDLNRALMVLRSLVPLDPALAAYEERLASLVVETDDVAADARARIAEPDPVRLAEVRDRLAELSRITKKYGDDEAAVLSYLDRARARRDELASAGEGIQRDEQERAEALAAARDVAERLSRRRRDAAEVLEREAAQLFGELALEGARLVVRLTPRELYEGGIEDVEFLVAMNPGETPKPVSKVASGGELARVALTLHLLTASEAAPTLVFDEVDAGVGGEAARAVGRALARLAHNGAAQVLVVTHLPQVAALADAHLKVTKEGRSARVDRVEGERRVAELSRMMTGLPDSESARDHARELLELRAEELTS